MLPFTINTPCKIAKILAERVKTLRLQQNWSRRTLAERSGVTEASLKRFETTGKISLERLLMLAGALGCLNAFEELLTPPPAMTLAELEKQLAKPSRKRGLQ